MKSDIIQKYTAIFADGTEITKTERDGFRNRLDFYNWICRKELGKKHGELQAIETKITL